jgi:predicted HicB family RNase H-like nuclease
MVDGPTTYDKHAGMLLTGAITRHDMSHLKEAVLARAAKPSKAVAKVVAVRIKTDNYAILAQAAKDEGVKVGELVRAAIDELCDQLAAKE